MRQKKLIIIACVLLLNACAAPTTRSPNVSQHEILTEGQTQSTLAKEARDKGQVPKTTVQRPVNVAQMNQRLNRMSAPIGKSGETLCHVLDVKNQFCRYQFKLENSKDINAYADGQRIVVSTGMMQFAKEDTELAVVLGHELAHNLLRHVKKKQRNTILGAITGLALEGAAAAAGVDTGGQLAKAGMQYGSQSYSPEFEKEADYVGLYVTARAGYDIHNAPQFWRKMSIQFPQSIYVKSTHPSNAERYVLLEKTVKEIELKKAAGLALTPEMKPIGQ